MSRNTVASQLQLQQSWEEATQKCTSALSIHRRLLLADFGSILHFDERHCSCLVYSLEARWTQAHLFVEPAGTGIVTYDPQIGRRTALS